MHQEGALERIGELERQAALEAVLCSAPEIASTIMPKNYCKLFRALPPLARVCYIVPAGI